MLSCIGMYILLLLSDTINSNVSDTINSNVSDTINCNVSDTITTVSFQNFKFVFAA